MKTKLSILLLTLPVFASANSVMTTETAAQAPQRGLKMKASKVPSFAIHEAKGKLPRLNIGREAVLTFTDGNLGTVPTAAVVSSRPQVMRPSPAAISLPKGLSVAPAAAAQVVKATAVEKQTLPEFPLITEPSVLPSEVKARSVRPLSDDEVRLLQAQILHEKQGHADIALGLLAPLMKKSAVGGAASAAYAAAAKDLGLTSEFRTILLRMAQDKKDKAAVKVALEQIVNNTEALEVPDLGLVQKLVEDNGIEITGKDAYNFYRAKHFLEAGDLTQVNDALTHVSDKSKFRADTLLVGALMSYRANKLGDAIRDLEELLAIGGLESSVESLGAITLARIRFQQSEYEAATKAYLRVSKDNPLWLQAMSERAWVQILTKDHEGAAGNMFSLHTDFFKNAFSPESYTVRSVAYLNLCQFGDGYQVLKNLSRRYGPLVNRIDKYRSEHKGQEAVFETVRSWLRDPSQKEANGLPRFFVVELARHPSYVRPQTRINRLEDEKESFTKATLSLIQKEKDLIKAQSEAREEIAKLKERASSDRNGVDLHMRVQNLERRIATLKVQYDLAKIARTQMKEARENGIARIELEKKELKNVASVALNKRLMTLHTDLTTALDQNEVLQYEVLAGAGEHLRAQSAGAETAKAGPDRRPAAQDRMTWKFQGEIWEDEVGHYRSSLKNVCSQNDQIASY